MNYRDLCFEKSRFLLRKSVFFKNITNCFTFFKNQGESSHPGEYYMANILSQLTSLHMETCRAAMKLMRLYVKILAGNVVHGNMIHFSMDTALMAEASITSRDFAKTTLPHADLLSYLNTREYLYIQLLWTILCYIRNSGQRYSKRSLNLRIEEAKDHDDLDMLLKDPYFRLIFEVGLMGSKLIRGRPIKL